jgi:hypothetical protein
VCTVYYTEYEHIRDEVFRFQEKKKKIQRETEKGERGKERMMSNDLKIHSTGILNRKSGRWRQQHSPSHRRRSSKHKVDDHVSIEMLRALRPKKKDHNQRHRDSFQGCTSPDVNQESRIDTGLSRRNSSSMKDSKRSGNFLWGTTRAVRFASVFLFH